MSSPGLALTDNNSGHDLLTELRLSLLDGGHDHVTDTGSGETVQTRTNALDRDDVQVTSTGVVAAVEDGATIGRRELARFVFVFDDFVLWTVFRSWICGLRSGYKGIKADSDRVDK